MPAKITKMTPAQAAQMPAFVEKYIALGFSTAPADFDAATEAALKAYKLCNLDRPQIVLRMGSPYGATLGGILAWGALGDPQVRSQVWSQVQSQVRSQVRSQVWSQVESQVGSQVWSQVQSQVRSQVRSQVWSQVESQVGSQVWSQVGSQVGSQVESQVGSQVRSQVESQVRSQVWSQVGSQVESQVRSQVGSQVGSQVESSINNYRGGAFWASWIAYVAFFRDVLGWSDPVLVDRFAIDEALNASCGWLWWHENVLAISDRPCVLNRDAEGRLHNVSGPSIAYRDGWALHHWHGVLVPEYVIERPAEISVPRIESEQNAEVQRVMLDRYGWERFIVDSGAELLHQDACGKLYRRELANDEPLVCVQVTNSTPEPDGSFSRYMLRVPPDMKTARAAVAWTFGLRPNEYRPSIET